MSCLFSLIFFPTLSQPVHASYRSMIHPTLAVKGKATIITNTSFSSEDNAWCCSMLQVMLIAFTSQIVVLASDNNDVQCFMMILVHHITWYNSAWVMDGCGEIDFRALILA